MSSEDKNSCRFFSISIWTCFFPPSPPPFRFEFVNRFRSKNTNAVFFNEESERLNLSAQLMLDFNDWCVVFDFQGCFHKFRISSIFNQNRTAVFVVSKSSLRFTHSNVWHSKFHTRRARVEFHSHGTRHTLEWHGICWICAWLTTPVGWIA